ncbi:hypothetical protein [Entomohabitans teleogrylli]|uniref:hypothetical protein n=1 Tax=Entomohabitans teleogrylli TaxID=1384589 RepID=UPI0012B68F03|nr:hypothetical protein [Entomohabitans teleogrylli]
MMVHTIPALMNVTAQYVAAVFHLAGQRWGPSWGRTVRAILREGGFGPVITAE